MNSAIIKLLIKQEQEAMTSTSKDEVKDDNAFVDGLCAMLQRINAATSCHIITSTFEHLITMLGGTQFHYSHEFVNLPVSQLEATFEGLPVYVHIQRNKNCSGETVF